MAGLSITPLGTELLDDPLSDPATVEESLRNIARANRWFGGAAAVRFGLDRAVGEVAPGATLSLLDLGTGSGDLSHVAVRWGTRRGVRIKPVGLELNRAAAGLARSTGLATAVACAGMPPIGDKSVDVVLLSQVAHHLTSDSVVYLFRACDRLARRAVIVADLRRHPLAAPFFRLGARALGFDRVTLADGVTSLRRGFSRSQLLDLMAQAGVRGRVDQRPGFRLVATWQPKDG
ncbi:MAG TPA: methyltransferase domain-containing protein [Gemmatimonadales bacterium]|jgi:predicted nicotinamide N-methyase|nr:methyltransferase domain-containing protein [Gemmatimonadales bacterium]